MNAEPDPGSADLASAIAALRGQLLDAQRAGEGQGVSFGVGKVEVEFTVESKTTGTAGGGVKFWVVNADAKLDHARGSTHKIKVELLPTAPDGQTLKVAKANSSGPPPR